MEFIILLGAAALSLRVRDGLSHTTPGPVAQLTSLLSYGFINFTALYLLMAPLGKVELVYGGGSCALVVTRSALLVLMIIALATGFGGAILRARADFNIKITEVDEHECRETEKV